MNITIKDVILNPQERKNIEEKLKEIDCSTLNVYDYKINRKGTTVSLTLDGRSYRVIMGNKPAVLKQIQFANKQDKFFTNYLYTITYGILEQIQEERERRGPEDSRQSE